MKNAETIRAREARELARREKQLQAKNNRFYMLYLFMVLSLIYIIDEIASTISIQFQSNIINEFFVQNMGLEYGEGLSLSSALGFITYPVTLLIVFYRPLADRFGRKPFLVINTIMMGLGLFLVYLSRNIFVYMVGGTLMGFMVSHDMQCVYILECSSEKNRARNYALTNGHIGDAADSAAAGHAYEKPERAVAFGVLSARPSGLCAVPGGAAVRKGDKCICGKQGEILKDSCGGKGEADQGREKQ